MVTKKIVLTPYQVNNSNLMIHIAKENGVYFSSFETKAKTTNAIFIADCEESFERFLNEWNRVFTELFVYCERYKALNLPHLRTARSEKVEKLISVYKLNGKYEKEYVSIIKYIRKNELCNTM